MRRERYAPSSTPMLAKPVLSPSWYIHLALVAKALKSSGNRNSNSSRSSTVSSNSSQRFAALGALAQCSHRDRVIPARPKMSLIW